MANLRGIDVIGQGLLNGIPGLADALNKHVAELKRREEVNTLIQGLLARSQGAPAQARAMLVPQPGQPLPTGEDFAFGPKQSPADWGGFTPLPTGEDNAYAPSPWSGGANPVQLGGGVVSRPNSANLNPSMVPAQQGVSPFDPSNFGDLGRIGELSPPTLNALAMTQPKQFRPQSVSDKSQNPNHQIVKSVALSPDGKPHVYADTVDKTTGKLISRYDQGEAPQTGKSGMGDLSRQAASQLDIPTMEFNYQMFKTDGNMPKFTSMAGLMPTIKQQAYIAKRAMEDDTPAAAFAAQKALYSTAKAGLGAVQKMKDTAVPVAKASNGYLDLVEKQLRNGYRPPTDSPLANEYIQWATSGRLMGDPQYQAYKNYIFAAVRDYAKVITGSHGSVAGLSDFATKNVEDILNVMQSPEMAMKSIETMRADLDVVVRSWTEQSDELRKAMQTQVVPSGTKKPKSPPGTPGSSDKKKIGW